MSRKSVNHRMDDALFWFFIFAQVTSVQNQMANVDLSTCGSTKSCWREPDGCATGKCTLLLTWKKDDNGLSISFEMEGEVSDQNSYVAFGLSKDQQMGDDSVVICVYNTETKTFNVQSTWNIGRSGTKPLSDPQTGLVPGSASFGYINGRVVCKFQRLIKLGSITEWYPVDSSTYYILMALGPASQGIAQYHSVRSYSGEKFNFSTAVVTISNSAGGGSDDQLFKLRLIKAHGILMVLAWMVFASFGMLMPRYFKMAWSDSTWCGKKIWFQIHQPCMIITLLLTTAGFIIIFVEAGVYVDDLPSPTMAHPPLGIIVMIFVLTNPIMAIFRCEPESRFRVIFNICHFIVGLLSHVTAVVTIFLGLYMFQLNLPLWTKGVMAAFICFHALIEVVLAIHMHRDKCCKSQSAEFQDIAMEPVGKYGATKSAPGKVKPVGKGSLFKTIVLMIHLWVVCGCAIAISVQIGIS